MADTDTKTQDQMQWEQQHPGQPYPGQPGQQFGQGEQSVGYAQADPRSQGQFDNLFSEQVFNDQATREVANAYWQQAEDTLRQARRISEIYAMSLMQGQLVQKITQAVVPQIKQYLAPQIAQQVTQQVIAQLQQNPQLLQPVVKQAMAQSR